MTIGKILILGDGYLATVFAAYYRELGTEVVVYPASEISLLDPLDIRRVMEKEQPTRVINTVAYTATAAAELAENRALAFQLNVQVPCTLVEALSVPWLHFSTGMMFDGPSPAEGWKETDTPTPSNYYSWTKAWADGAILPFAEHTKVIIARIHLPVSSVNHPRNFLDRVGNFEKVISEPSSITVVDDVLPIIDQLFEQQKYGLYNLANPGLISAHDIAIHMQQSGEIPVEKEIQSLTLAELDSSGGAKQSFPVLNIEKIQALDFHLPDAKTSLENILKLRAERRK